jgi:DNA-binding IclR family transcriptional regulator
VRAYSSIGGRAPAHWVASGKALLSRTDPARLDRLLAEGLPAWTERTVTDPGSPGHNLGLSPQAGSTATTGTAPAGRWEA